MNNQFADPYENLPRDSKVRVQAWTDAEVHRKLIGIHPGNGTIQTVINCLLKGLLDECTKLGINDYNGSEDFERLVIARSGTIQCAYSGSTDGSRPQAGASDVARRTEALRPEVKRSKNSSGSDKSRTRSRGPRKGV